MQPEDYTHRIGRTGRAGHSGQAFTLATHSERHKIRRIEHFIGQPIPLQTIEGLEPKKTARPTYTDRKGKGRPVRGGYAGDRNGSGGKPGYGRKPDGARAEFGSRPARPTSRDDRASFGDRPARAERPDFSSRAPRQEQPRFGDRAQRNDRPSFGDRPRSDRPAFGDRSTLGARPAGAGHSAKHGDARKGPSKPGAYTSTRARTATPRTGYAGKTSGRPGKSAARRSDFA